MRRADTEHRASEAFDELKINHCPGATRRGFFKN